MLFFVKADRSLVAVGCDDFMTESIMRNAQNIMAWKAEYSATTPDFFTMLVEAAALGVPLKNLQHYLNRTGADWYKAAVYMMIHHGHLHLIDGLWYANAIAEKPMGIIGVHEHWLMAMADLCKKLHWKPVKKLPPVDCFTRRLQERGIENFG